MCAVFLEAERIRCARTGGVKDEGEHPCGCWQSNLFALQEQPMLLIAEPSLMVAILKGDFAGGIK